MTTNHLIYMFKISASSQVRNNFFLNQKNNTVFFEYLLLATFYVVKETTVKIYTLATNMQTSFYNKCGKQV